ncbi:MAG: dTDP-4-dehydrorhamnose 3,5-epimerase [Syntrophus sp. PtaB.Bin001]|nr:MAG: dTDP-4-dehydrorhamnose 3,5-epimerase [Syntrophus sp. PtaB.Bin001]
MPFSFKPLSLPDVILVEPGVFPDDRGLFFEFFKASEFANAGLPAHFPQDNFSFSKKDVLRGLHYQKNPKAQGKLVSVLKGSVWDVAVDLRRQSPSFLKWVSAELNDRNRAMLYIPPGFAHGFLALTDDVHFLYKCTHEYDQQADAGVRWDDPEIGIPWPIKHPILSEKDRVLPSVSQAELF